MTSRGLAFVTVGAVGFLLQLITLALLLTAGWPYVPATAAAVAAAVLHNFVWHERWTWRDRVPDRHGRLRRLVKYLGATGFASVAGNVMTTAACVEIFGLPAVAANAAGVAVMAMTNFAAADRWVFVRAAGLLVGVLVLVPPPASAADAPAATAAEWQQYVARATRHLHQPSAIEPEGASIDIPGGTIHHWRGATVVRRTTVDAVVGTLLDRGTPPPQDDVLESRVLARNGESLRVYLKLARTTLVTVVYDTEHDVAFSRHSSRLAASRSVSTRIEEAGGADRGFLWRLNSYWRYTQVGHDVRIELESLSLSRDIPWFARAIAAPLANRIARESVARTLGSLRSFLEAGSGG